MVCSYRPRRLENAFDSIERECVCEREKIIRLLNKTGMEEKLIKAIANIYMED